jgi:hypothetical protein
MTDLAKNSAAQRRMHVAVKCKKLVFVDMEKQLAGELGTHRHRGDSIFGRREVVGDAGGLLGADHDAYCDAVNARGLMGRIEAAHYRYHAGC